MEDIPPLDPTVQDEGDVLETVGATAAGGTSLPPAVEDIVPEGAQEQTATVENQPLPLIEEVHGLPPAPAAAVGQPKERVEEPPVEARAASETSIVDIAKTLGAPTVTVVQSTL